MASSSLLAVPSKRADTVKFGDALARYLTEEQSADPASLSESVSQLEELRDASLVRKPEPHETSLKNIQKYYGQLINLAKRVPFMTDKYNGQPPTPVNLNFTWYESMEPSGFFSKKRCALNNINLEHVCVMYNIAALASQVAATQNLTHDDQLKVAVNYLTLAAKIFNHLKTAVPQFFTTPPAVDLNPVLLGAFSDLMAAQAQECFWYKAKRGNSKDNIVAMLSAQVMDFYDSAFRALNGRPDVDKAWAPFVKAKLTFFNAETHFRLGRAAAAAEKYGEQVARFRAAHAVAQQAARLEADAPGLKAKDLLQAVTQELAGAEKDNNVIYLQQVPDVGTLPLAKRHPMVKPTDPLPDFSAHATAGDDLFTKIIPAALMEHVKVYDDRRNAMVDGIVMKLRGCTTETVEALTSMGLPGAIDAGESPDELPQPLLDKAQEIQGLGGMEAITALVENLPSLHQNCKDILDETKRMLDGEEREDKEMRNKYKDEWKRAESRELTQQSHDEVTKYNSFLSKAAESDGTVRSRFNECKGAFILLCKSEAELARAIPSGHASAKSAAEKDAVQKLKGLLSTLDQLRLTRDKLETDIKAMKDSDDVSRLVASAGQDADLNALFDKELAKYTPFQAQADTAIAETKTALQSTREANDKYVSVRAGDTVSEREKIINDLSAKYEAYKEIKFNLDEGTKFYGNLTTLLMKLQNKVKQYCEARKTEKNQLMSDVAERLARTPHESFDTHPTPGAGAGAAAASAAAASRPSRPPPPATSQPPAQPASQPPPAVSSAPPPVSHPQPAYSAPPVSSSAPPPPYAVAQAPGYGQPPPNPYGQPPQGYYGGPPPGSYGAPMYGMPQYGYQPPQPWQQQPPPQPWQQQPPPQPWQQQPPPQQPWQQPPPQHQPHVPSYGAVPQAQPSANEWRCPACTFHNSNLLPRCEMCNTPRS